MKLPSKTVRALFLVLVACLARHTMAFSSCPVHRNERILHSYCTTTTTTTSSSSASFSATHALASSLTFNGIPTQQRRKKRHLWRQVVPSRLILCILSCQVVMVRMKALVVILQQSLRRHLVQALFRLRLQSQAWECQPVVEESTRAFTYRIQARTNVKINHKAVHVGYFQPVQIMSLLVGFGMMFFTP